MLTTGVDAAPAFTGGAGDDNYTATDTTLTALDALDGGAGNDVLTLNDTVGTNWTAVGFTVANIETANVRAGAAGLVVDSSTWTGLADLNVTQAVDATLTAAATTDVTVSSATGDIVVNDGKDVSVTDDTASTDIIIDGAAGAITVTDTDNAGTATTDDITIDGGTTVTVTATADADSGNIEIGTTTQASGAVTVTQNLNSDGSAAVAGGAITVTGGTTIAITSNATSTAADDDSDADITIGTITANADDNTTTVTVIQNDAVTTVSTAAVADIGKTATVTFLALTATQTTTVNGLTFTAAKNLTAAEVAAAFANLTSADGQSATGITDNGIFTGSNTAGWTSGAANGAVVTYTSAADDTADIVVTAGAVDPTLAIVAGTNGSASDLSTNAVVNGKVVVEGGDALTTVTIDGYAHLSTIGATTNADALTTVSLANSAGSMTVHSDVTALALTVNNVIHTVDLGGDGDAVTSLTLTTTGEDSSIALDAAAATSLTVNGTEAVDLTGGTFTALTTLTVSGSASVTMDGDEADSLTSVTTTGTTGTVTITIGGDTATYTGGAGVDAVTLDHATVSKAINLGGGDDSLTLLADTTTVPTVEVVGGEGTDTVSMTIASAESAAGFSSATAFRTKVTGFERLVISDIADGGTADSAETLTVDMAALGFGYVTTTGTTIDASAPTIESDDLVLDNMDSGDTVVLTAEGYVSAVLADATGTDTFNVIAHAENAAEDLGTFTIADVETVNITTVDLDTDDNADAQTELVLVATSATAITVSGDADLVLDTSANTSVATINASSMTGALEVTLAGTTATTITTGSGADTIIASNDGDTINAGEGVDTITTGDLAQITTGAGNDIIFLHAATNSSSYATLLDLTAGDTIDLDSGDAGTVVFSAAGITLADTAVFQDYANAAARSFTTDGNNATWFQYMNNTYIVQSGDTTDNDFQNGTDMIVKISGLVDLGADASYNLTIGTLELA